METDPPYLMNQAINSSKSKITNRWARDRFGILQRFKMGSLHSKLHIIKRMRTK
jgi:hypothetical protein